MWINRLWLTSLLKGKQMEDQFTGMPYVISSADLKSVLLSLSVLAEISMNLGEYVMAKKLRDSVAFTAAKIERLKEASKGVPAIP